MRVVSKIVLGAACASCLSLGVAFAVSSVGAPKAVDAYRDVFPYGVIQCVPDYAEIPGWVRTDRVNNGGSLRVGGYWSSDNSVDYVGNGMYVPVAAYIYSNGSGTYYCNWVDFAYYEGNPADFSWAPPCGALRWFNVSGSSPQTAYLSYCGYGPSSPQGFAQATSAGNRGVSETNGVMWIQDGYTFNLQQYPYVTYWFLDFSAFVVPAFVQYAKVNSSSYSDAQYGRGYADGASAVVATDYNNMTYQQIYEAGAQAGRAQGSPTQLDLYSMFAAVLTMPFTFMASTFDTTLFAGTQFAFNVSIFIYSVFIVLLIWKILSLVFRGK